MKVRVYLNNETCQKYNGLEDADCMEVDAQGNLTVWANNPNDNTMLHVIGYHRAGAWVSWRVAD